jgi:hypothetical protein
MVFFQESLTLYRELSDMQGTADTLAGIAAILFRRSDYTGATAFYRQSIELYNELMVRLRLAREKAHGLKHLFAQSLRYVWLLLLGIALLVSAHSAYRRTLAVEEYPFGCDSFGYLQMAKEIRVAAARRELPRFSLDPPHTRLLIDFLRWREVPFSSWFAMVAPHAHHYFPRAGHVGVQYPPGTGLLLALFSEGEAVHGLNRVVIWLFIVAGALALIIAGRKQAWAAAGGVIFALEFGLEVLSRIGTSSFSINALLAPLLLSLLFLFAALRLSTAAAKPRAAWMVSCLGGLFFGLAILVRLPTILLLPGLLLLLIPLTGRAHSTGLAIAFGLGVLLGGVLPLLIHQQRLAGAWYLPTYSELDNSSPSLVVLKTNAPFYLSNGPGSQGNWALFVALIGFAGLAMFRGKGAKISWGLGWGRLAWSTLAFWGASTAYFLTHRITTDYYQIPATFGAVTLLMLGAFTIDSFAGQPENGRVVVRKGRLRRLALLLLALAPGIVALASPWSSGPWTRFSPEAPIRTLLVPAELTDKRTWIFADMLTGTLWYYAERPAYKITFATSATRALVYRFISARREPQYVIRDSPEMQPVLDEIMRMGGIPEERGKIDGYPYYLIHWPEGGPAGGAALNVFEEWIKVYSPENGLSTLSVALPGATHRLVPGMDKFFL